MADDFGSSDAGNDFSGGGSSSSGGFDLTSAATLGVGALGVGAMLSAPHGLPAQFGQLQAGVPGMQDTAHSLEAKGSGLVGQGQEALAMGQRGELTPEQQAQLKVYSGGLTNQARQQYANMGRNPDQDTSFLSASADIDAHVNAMAQQQIQTTIQLGLGEISGGNALIGEGLGFENAANQALLAAGQAQMQADKNYSDSLTSAFKAIGSMMAFIP